VAFKEYDIAHSSRYHKSLEKNEENEENEKNEKTEKNRKSLFHFSEKSEESALTVDRGRIGEHDVLENKEISGLDRIKIDISERIDISDV
jgi:hypothetical protein